MIHALISYEAQSSTCSNSGRIPRASTYQLETAKVDTIDVGHAVVVLIVFGFADIDPFFGVGYAIDDQFRESVWILRLESRTSVAEDTDSGL